MDALAFDTYRRRLNVPAHGRGGLGSASLDIDEIEELGIERLIVFSSDGITGDYRLLARLHGAPTTVVLAGLLTRDWAIGLLDEVAKLLNEANPHHPIKVVSAPVHREVRNADLDQI